MSAKSGFTLIELLVVIAIMAIVGAYTLSNYASFGEDQKLKNAVLDVQSQLRLAQTNATSNTKCEDENSAIWQVLYVSNNIGFLKCLKPSTPIPTPPPVPPPPPAFTIIKPFRLDLAYHTIQITSVSGSPSPSCPTYRFNQFIVDFASLTGKVNFKDEAGSYYPNCNSLTITLINSKISPNCTGANLAKCKSLIIEKGGRIYAE